MYKQNYDWVTNTMKQGYSFIDAGKGQCSESVTCYGMETDVIKEEILKSG